VLDEGLKIYLQDNSQAWEMDGEGIYRQKASRRAVRKCAQTALLEQLASPPVKAGA